MRLASQKIWWWVPVLAVVSVYVASYAQAQDAFNRLSNEPTASGPSARELQSTATADQGAPATSQLIRESSDAVPDTGRRLVRSASRDDKNADPAGARNNDLLSSWAKGSGATALAALAFVVGLFTLFAWIMKRTMPKSAQVLPAEAVRILGRVPLGGRQFGQLLHLGNKLVLVHVTQAGVEKLAEIDDPEEVARLLAICSKSSKGSQKEFEEIFGQFAKDKTEPGFLGAETSLFSGANSTKGGRYA